MALDRMQKIRAKAGVMFKFASIYDRLKEFQLGEFIHCRITRTVCEVVILKGATESAIKTVGWILNHCVGTLHANIPRHGDNSALTHIANIKDDTKSQEIANAMRRNINTNNMPMHFVMASKFNLMLTPLMVNVSKLTLARVERGYKTPAQEYSTMVI